MSDSPSDYYVDPAIIHIKDMFNAQYAVYRYVIDLCIELYELGFIASYDNDRLCKQYGDLKNIAQIEHSRHPSFNNFIAKSLSAIAAYFF